MRNETYSLKELAELTGLTTRVIRSYIAQDLLHGPDSIGRNATYGAYHLNRLQVIKQLRDLGGKSLSEIRQYLMMAPEDEEIRVVSVGLESMKKGFLDSVVAEQNLSREDAPKAETSEERIYEAKAREPNTPLANVLALLSQHVRNQRVPRQSRARSSYEIDVTPDVAFVIRGDFDRGDVELFERLADALREALLGGVELEEQNVSMRRTGQYEQRSSGDDSDD